MLKKIYKNTGDLVIYGCNRWSYLKPLKDDSSFVHYGRTYRLSMFMRLSRDEQDVLSEFHGILNDSAFSGVLVKLSDCGECVKAFTFIG